MKKLLLSGWIVLVGIIVQAQNTSTGVFQHQADVGKPKLTGASSYDESSQTYTLRGAGYNIWFGRDEFHYLYKNLKGDFILTAKPLQLFRQLGEYGFTAGSAECNQHWIANSP